jgi:ubiquinone/menaquinone biosynthesis C-methylase UbiE
MTKEIKKWWEENSKSFQDEAEVPVGISYGPGMPTEKKLNLLGNVRKKNVLEIGCGGAQCGIGFAKQGAKVIGMDISEEQLKYAKRLSEKNNVKITLIKGDIVNLKKIKSNSQDIVFSSWALFYIDNLKKCFKEVHRVLKRNGIFVFATHHPIWENINKENMKVKRCYFDSGRCEEPNKKGLFVWYRRTFAELVNALTEVDFKIERVEEPDPRKKDEHTSTEKTIDPVKRKAMKLIPRTIIFKARKI